jgi:hypothetical protein
MNLGVWLLGAAVIVLAKEEPSTPAAATRRDLCSAKKRKDPSVIARELQALDALPDGGHVGQPVRSLLSPEGSAARRHRPSNSAPCSMANDM